jgi:hypothetical protein
VPDAQTSATAVASARDFDFLRGRWTILNRRLERPLDPASDDWREFTIQVVNRPLGGLGNVDLYRSDEFPGQCGFEALALRLFDQGEKLWRIWWASAASSGQLDHPVIGRFAGEHGVFECDDILAGRPVRVRYEWLRGTATPRWKQSFSFDGGATWRENWFMEWQLY